MSAPAPEVHYYIWYRVHGNLADAHRVIAALLDDVAARTAVHGRVLVRRDDPATWMEIYEGVTAPEDFERALAEAAARHRAAAIADEGARHVEAFVAVR